MGIAKASLTTMQSAVKLICSSTAVSRPRRGCCCCCPRCCYAAASSFMLHMQQAHNAHRDSKFKGGIKGEAKIIHGAIKLPRQKGPPPLGPERPPKRCPTNMEKMQVERVRHSSFPPRSREVLEIGRRRIGRPILLLSLPRPGR